MLLEGVLAFPEQRIGELLLLTPVERHQLLEWNDTQAEYPQDKSIHQLFEEQVERTPNAVSVVFEHEQLTYQELNMRANQMAHYLQSMGVGPETLVGICVDRSLDMVVGLLGVLKAGGAYVPLDPHYPSKRLALMISDAEISVLLTESRWLHTLPVSTVTTVYLDRDCDVIAKQSTDNLAIELMPETLAYVIYTSGSTGKPKGVMVQHDSLVNFTQAAVAEYGITGRDRVLQFASISFDAAAEEIYPCLVTGGTLVPTHGRHAEFSGALPQNLPRLTDYSAGFATAYWQQVVVELDMTELTLPESLQLLIIGGERVSPEHVKIWQAQVGDLPRLINTYGPTEATVVVTAFPIFADTQIRNEVPIGRALANVQTYVLDRHLQPVLIGVPGELYIGGRGLARGYLNRPELSDERFIPNPFSDASARLYKTGDLVRYLPDGNLEFLGRIDDQVKIRGFRVELGEIEAALVQHPQVQAGVVVARAAPSGSQALVAYIVLTGPVSASELRAGLKAKLPDYMVPGAIVFLEALPLTPSGKVDRQALPAPDPSQRTVDAEFIAPETATEVEISRIWGELLNLERVGICDNFFELGGHSLLATQVLTRLRQTLQIELPLRSLFEYPTIVDLAKQIDRLAWLRQTTSSTLETSVDQTWEAIEL